MFRKTRLLFNRRKSLRGELPSRHSLGRGAAHSRVRLVNVQAKEVDISVQSSVFRLLAFSSAESAKNKETMRKMAGLW